MFRSLKMGERGSGIAAYIPSRRSYKMHPCPVAAARYQSPLMMVRWPREPIERASERASPAFLRLVVIVGNSDD